MAQHMVCIIIKKHPTLRVNYIFTNVGSFAFFCTAKQHEPVLKRALKCTINNHKS